MRKLALNVEDIRVASFEAGAAEAARGTVDGHAVKPSVTCETQVETCETMDHCQPNQTYDGWTCEVMCDHTSWHSCYNTCVHPPCQM